MSCMSHGLMAFTCHVLPYILKADHQGVPLLVQYVIFLLLARLLRLVV